MILSPSQSVVFKGIKPADKDSVNAILKANNVPQIDDIDDLVRQSIACPAFPMCGLAVAEAERRMPAFNEMVREILTDIGMPEATLRLRMTGCPNGCARPYMPRWHWWEMDRTCTKSGSGETLVSPAWRKRWIT